MFLWFVGVSFVAVWAIFRSPAIDYRLVMAGSVLPLVDLAVGRPFVLHTLAGAVLLLALVMAVTVGRRLRRRRWLGVPIGVFCHLVLDGTWTDTQLFWWPVAGVDFAARRLPEFENLALGAVAEVAGVAALVWMVRRFRLDDPARRRDFLRTGALGRDLAR